MRIRQVRPEFWQSEEVASMPEGLRLFYIGLWCVADDAGYFVFHPARIAADLYPYDGRARRERLVTARLAALVESGHVRTLGECGHALVPTLSVHQKVGGNPSYVIRARHRAESVPDQTSPDESVSNVRLGNGRERNGTNAREADARVATETTGLKGRLGEYAEIVKAPS